MSNSCPPWAWRKKATSFEWGHHRFTPPRLPWGATREGGERGPGRWVEHILYTVSRYILRDMSPQHATLAQNSPKTGGQSCSALINRLVIPSQNVSDIMFIIKFSYHFSCFIVRMRCRVYTVVYNQSCLCPLHDGKVLRGCYMQWLNGQPLQFRISHRSNSTTD